MKNAYAYIGAKEVTIHSSSGGAFMAIAKAFFETYERGKVYGVVFGDELNVEYAVAETFEECNRFQGSKYVQSDLKGTHKQMIEALKDGEAVLFVGTPCLVAGVRKVVQSNGAPCEKLWLVDLICHGTVDKKLWKDYLFWIEKRHRAKVEEYSFRYKPVGWRGYPIYVRLSNGKELIDTYETRTYIRAFLKCFSMRDACFRCPFKTIERMGDVTLGDFWGAEATLKDSRVSSGVSLCLENNEKGLMILQKIKANAAQNGDLLENLDETSYMQRQDNLRRALIKPKEYEMFWSIYEKRGFDEAIRKTGIFTIRGRIRASVILLLKKTRIYSFIKK